MNKNDIANYCSKKLGVTESTTITLAGDFAKARYRMIWDSMFWRQSRYQATIAVTAGTSVVELAPEFELVEAIRPANGILLNPTADYEQLASSPLSDSTVGPLLAFSQIGRSTAGNAQIRLYQKPNTDQTLLILGKQKCADLNLGVDTPLIPGVDNCLCAFVCGDLAQWLRQYDKAEIHFREANALLQQMVNIEQGQSAEIRRMIPEVQMLEDGF